MQKNESKGLFIRSIVLCLLIRQVLKIKKDFLTTLDKILVTVLFFRIINTLLVLPKWIIL